MAGKIVGIDLGTSTSEIAFIEKGIPVVIPNSLGKLVTPSVVHIGEDGTVLVGEQAAEYLFTRPECTFMEVKRLTGTGEMLRAHGKEYTPSQVQAMLLRYLIDCARDYTGENIERAVITVPAYFTDVQRRETVQAGELAGITVERILNEPTAAALDYGLSNLSDCKRMMVYDLGGGTLDITVLELMEGVIEVSASCGNNHLGGKDFDEILMKHLADPKGDIRAKMRLKKAAQDCKIALSAQDVYSVSLPFLRTSKSGKPVSVEKPISRGEFEAWIRESVESTREPMEQALFDSNLKPADLDGVLLVGGSTRIPLVRRLVAEWSNLEPKALVDPELTVARGAAIQAGILEGSFTGERELVLIDVCPYTLGTDVLRETELSSRIVFDAIIPRNTTIPVEKSKIYYPARDYQTMVQIGVYQGEFSDPENNEKLGEVKLSGIPATRKNRQPIEVTFSYDMNGILQVKARAVSNGMQISAEINTAGVTPKPPVDINIWEKALDAKRHRPVIRRAEKRIAAGEDISGELALLSTRIKEALVRNDPEHAEELRAELLQTIRLIDIGNAVAKDAANQNPEFLTDLYAETSNDDAKGGEKDADSEGGEDATDGENGEADMDAVLEGMFDSEGIVIGEAVEKEIIKRVVSHFTSSLNFEPSDDEEDEDEDEFDDDDFVETVDGEDSENKSSADSEADEEARRIARAINAARVRRNRIHAANLAAANRENAKSGNAKNGNAENENAEIDKNDGKEIYFIDDEDEDE